LSREKRGSSPVKYAQAISLPSGETCASELGSWVNWSGSPPLIGTLHKVGLPPIAGDQSVKEV